MHLSMYMYFTPDGPKLYRNVCAEMRAVHCLLALATSMSSLVLRVCFVTFSACTLQIKLPLGSRGAHQLF